MAHSPSLKSLMDLSGRTFLISGGAGLLGSEISDGLAELGARVIIASRNLHACEAVAAAIGARWGGEVFADTVDITDPATVTALFDRIGERHGPLNGLVNCSGYGRKNTWESIGEADWMSDIDVSLTGPFRMAKGATQMLKQTSGVVLNVASMYAHVAPDHRLYDGERYANPPSYGAAKAGVLQLTRYMASFLSPYGIRVNAISPGPFPLEQTQTDNPDFIGRLGEKTMAGRIGRAHEVKGAAVLLCTDAASYITGETIAIDGGWTAW